MTPAATAGSSAGSFAKKAAHGPARVPVPVCPPRNVFYGINQSATTEDDNLEASYWFVDFLLESCCLRLEPLLENAIPSLPSSFFLPRHLRVAS